MAVVDSKFGYCISFRPKKDLFTIYMEGKYVYILRKWALLYTDLKKVRDVRQEDFLTLF